jgi:NodT family efflux transporter outer membrane factor (OMF) lipoprotein
VALLLLSLTALAGCNLAPAYRQPVVTTPAAYSDMGPWSPASPDDAAPRGAWWTIYNDPVLNGLEARIDASNPTLGAALFQYDQAVQALNEARAAFFPVLDVNASGTQNRQSEGRPLRVGGPDHYEDAQVVGSFSYELDLWGRVRNLVAEGKAQTQASGAQAAAIRLSLEAQLADAYFSLRGLDAQQKLLQETTAAYGHALQLTEYQHAGGEVSGLDVSQAQAQYQAAEAQLQDAIASRALYLHEIASLIGVPAPSFVLTASPNLPLPPPVPVATPSDLLQRRPDIASAERQVAAANAGIGVTRAAFFPSISLGASGGWQAHGGGVNLFDVKNTLWSLGPGLALTLFEGGYRRAANRIAIDQFDAATENYRSVVLTAFQQVEDNLVLCNRLAAEAAREDLAVQAAVQSTNLSMALYQGGAVTYLNVVSAETSQLLAQQTALSIGTRRLQASVNLIQALGGGWTPATPLPPAMAAAANPAAKS